MFSQSNLSKSSLLILFATATFFLGGAKAEASCNCYPYACGVASGCAPCLTQDGVATGCVAVEPVCPGAPYGADCSSYSPPTQEAPIGTVDSASSGTVGGSCGSVNGWVFDPDISGYAINVHMYVDGPWGSRTGGTGYDAGATTINRPDVNSAYYISGRHGYSFQLPSLSVGTHSVYVYGIGVDGGGIPTQPNSLLNPAPTTFTCTAPTYTYSFNSNGGTPTYTSATGIAGSSITYPGSPTKLGNTFTGWLPIIPTTMSSGGGSSVAQWSVNACSNGANNPPTCNTCTAPQVYNTVTLSCVAPTYSCDNLPPGGANWNTTAPSSSLWTSRVHFDSDPGPSTACTYYCDSTHTWDGAKCALKPTDCYLDRTTITSRYQITAYNSRSVTFPVTCASKSEIRYCTNGRLSGTYPYVGCTQLEPTITSFTVTPARVRSNGTVTIKWSTTDVTSCSVKKSGSSKTWRGTSSEVAVPSDTSDTVTGQTTYTLTCVGVPSSPSVTVNVVPSYEEF